MVRIVLGICVLVFLSFAFSSCVTHLRAKKAQSVCRDIAYGPKRAQRLDIYFPPDGPERRGIVVAIHGGGWMTGSKEDMTECGRLLASQGYVTLSANYRLALKPGLRGPTIADMLDDVDAILDFAREREDELGCDASRVALVGFSAGAHLSMMKALARNGDGRVKACVSISGVSDLADPVFHENIIGILKARIVTSLATGKLWNPDDPDAVALFRELSPITHVPNASCPVVIVHGSEDRIVPVAQARSLADALASRGKDVTYVEGEGLDHELPDAAFRESFANGTLLPVLRRTIR